MPDSSNSNQAAVNQLSDGRPGGVSLGQAITDKVSAYGVTTVAQPASANQDIVAESGSATATACVILACCTSLAQANKVLINEMRANFMSLGWIKGAA